MILNSPYIKDLLYERGWSQNELARQMGISKGTLSDAVNRKTTIGKKFVKCLIKVFPDEKFENLVIKEVRAIERMPIKASPYNHQVNAYNFAGYKLGIFKEVVSKCQEQRS